MIHTNRRSRRSLAAIVVLLTALAGCGTRPPPPEAGVPTALSPAVSVPEGTARPTLPAAPLLPPGETTAPPPQTTFVISLLGDCTLTSSHYAGHFEKTVGDDLAYPFSNVADLLHADDLTIANLECCFSDKELRSQSQYAFCAPPKYANSLRLGGIDCVTLGNNHINDFGAPGVADTLAVLEDVGLPAVEADGSAIMTLCHSDGTTLKVGIYVLPINGSPRQMEQEAEQLRQEGAQLVIACMHAGVERIYVPTKRQTALAHAAVSGGADLVVGTHPHILQPAEIREGGIILYSLGNFCFGGNVNPTDKDTVIAQLTVTVTPEGLSKEIGYIPCRISSTPRRNDYRPTPYAVDSEGYLRCLQKMQEPWDKTTAEEAAAAEEARRVAEETTAEAAVPQETRPSPEGGGTP